MLNYYKDYAYLGVQYTGVAHRYGVNGKISGNMAALSELRDCAVVVHGPVGCGFHYRYSMRSSFSPYYNLESTALNNSDVVFSGEGKLRETLKRVLDRQPEMIAVVSTCVADVLGEDVQGIVNDFASHNALEKTKKIITVNSEVFSHPDKISFMKRLKERVWNNGNKNIKSDAQFCGCGFIEVLNTLVDQVMEYQPVVPNSVNLESFAWGYGGTEKMQGVIDMLQRIGITVNTILPTGGYEQIRTAPRAQLNVARRIRWAQRMQNRFGTEYVHFPNLGEWAGVKGIEEFYCKIAEHFDKEYVAKKIIAEEFAKHEYDIEAAKRHLSSFSYGLVTSVISEIPDTIELYEQEYRMPLKFIALMLPESYQAEARLDDATMEKMFQNIKDAINATGTKAVFMLNPTEKELLEAASKVDCLVGNGLLRIKNLNTPCLASNAEVRYLDFANYAKALHNMALQVGKGAGTSKLLWHLLDINKEYYPITNDANALASREMWFSYVEEEMKPVHGCYLFGVYRACVGIKDAVILFHSIAGCHIGTLMMHLNNDLENVHQGCSVVYEQDIVFGGQKQLGKALQNVKELYPEMKLLIVISGCIPNMIGDDVDAEIARAELNVSAIHIAAAGTDGSEQDGFKSALLRLIELIEPAQELQEGLINVWGVSEDDPRMTADLIALQKLVGSKVKLQYLGAACSLAELKAAAKAELNIIFGGHLELAQQLEERFGTPYIMADYPYGLSGMISLQQQITEHLPYLDYTEQQQAAVSCLRSELKKAAYYLNFMYGIPVAIIGDKARSAGMKHFLSEELGMKVVFFNDDCQADLADCCEKIKNSNAVLLFGSSFARGIANELGIPLIPLFYPVFDQIVLGYKPFIGVEGVLNIIEVIVNSFMQQKHKPHGNFAQISKELECGGKQDEV